MVPPAPQTRHRAPKVDDMKIPVVELGDCIQCEVCREACPSVFRMNEAGYIEVVDFNEYPEAEVEEAIKNCPVDCISWAQI